MTDRTAEFQSLVSVLPPPARPASKVHRGHKEPQTSASRAVATLGEFHAASSGIAKDIHAVAQKLAQLTTLVQQRGLFNDPTSEINRLVHGIKSDMQALNNQLDAAQMYVDRQKSQLGDKNQSTSHSVNVVGQLKSELMNTAVTFKDVLQQRSSNLKAQKDHQDLYFKEKTPAVSLARPSVYKPLGISPLKQPHFNENGVRDAGGGI
ncbi:unnamed protein product, partial [Discosporangium mesarthrocarpum]